MIKPNERFHFNNPIFSTTKFGLISLSVYNSVLNITAKNNHFMFTNSKISIRFMQPIIY